MLGKPPPPNNQIMLAQGRDEKGLVQELSSINKEMTGDGMGDVCSRLAVITLCTDCFIELFGGDTKELGHLNCLLSVYKEISICSCVSQCNH